MRGWGEPYRASLELGLRQLARRRHLREAIVRLAVPMDPSRYLEIPWALRRLGAARGDASWTSRARSCSASRSPGVASG